MNGLLGFLRGLQSAQPARTPPEQAIRAVIDSVELEQHKDRAILSAVATTDQLRELASTPAATSSQSK